MRVERWRARAERLDAPVWSIGNLTWGGSGKTPVVAAVAAWARDRGRRVAVLSRGYGRSGRDPLVVSRGEGPLVPPALAGDEPWLLADELPRVAVAVAAQRADAARRLAAEMAAPPDLYLLDDGFSHLSLARDLDVLVLPVDDPFAGGRFPPGGRLREPLAAAARAHVVLLTGNGATAADARQAGEILRRFGFAGAAFACSVETMPPRRVIAPSNASATEAAAALAGPVLLVTGIARPERVRASAVAAGVAVAEHLAFPDHHDYPARSVHRIADAARRAHAVAVLTTSKDRGKLAGRLEVPLWELPVAAVPEPAFWAWLAERLGPAE
jgi:tetraacyldisaccharide 4'-kinase